MPGEGDLVGDRRGVGPGRPGGALQLGASGVQLAPVPGVVGGGQAEETVQPAKNRA
ncbi:hypothetical protein ACIOC2_01365 [Streptomyces sp. NPDC088337]|uniref:hypothetical protein n=1 Tax=unclassified Streptomyces TaxID=2593676 RepID=UPI003804E20E